MNVQIPVKWLQELLALCGPEDHELRERVMVSITAMDEQTARAVAMPEPDEQVKELMVLIGKYGSAVEANSTGNPSNYTLASDESAAYEAIKAKLRALLAGLSAPAAQVEEIQWRNIKKVVDALADLCFGSVNDPKWGIAHIAIRHSLVSKDGLDIKALGLEPLATAPQPEHDLKDVPCECCGYMTYHREHMGCIRAAAPKAAPGNLLEFRL